jgi:DNA-directed RNA polymerase sigma subunit (sigma70/sigma32)
MSKKSAVLAGVEPVYSLPEIADQLGLTRERVRQIEVSALKKARLILERRGIEPAMFLDEWHRSTRAD